MSDAKHLLIYLRRDQAELMRDALSLAAAQLHDRWDTLTGFEKLQEIKTMAAILDTHLKPREDVS